MAAAARWLNDVGRATLARLDGLFNRLYTWRYNPLYHSGALAVASFLVLLFTGIYLLLFYRIGSPYASVADITGQVWLGRWIRGLHRYASDVAVVAVAVHALRMFVQGRSWGPRTLAWISGLLLVGVFLVCGWTGYVMIWDVQAQVLAVEGARFLDVLPIFSEPISRTFVGGASLPGAFFFLNLFLHIALPIGMALLLWIHVARVARPALLPPRGLLWGMVGLLFAASVVVPVGMAPEANLLRIPGEVPLDVFYGFWLPLTRLLPAWAVWAGGGAVTMVLLAVPWWSRPREAHRPEPSFVDEGLCTGCRQCFLDCPYEAIAMVPREEEDGRSERVARVDPDLCVSCGICAGSCAPMGVGPPERTGRDQLQRVRAFVDVHAPDAGDVVVVACYRGAGGVGGLDTFEGAPVYGVACGGSLHTSVIEYLVRSGAGGVLVMACPPRDCWNREGVKWLGERMYHDREAELQERVDRRRVHLAFAGEGERGRVAAALEAFRAEIRALAAEEGEDEVVLDTDCEIPPEDEEARVEMIP